MSAYQLLCTAFCLFNESIHVRFARLKLCQTLFFLRNLFLQHTLLVCVIAGEHPVLLVCHAPENIVLIEPFEQLDSSALRFFITSNSRRTRFISPPQLRAVFLVDMRRELPLLHAGEMCDPAEIIQNDLREFTLPDVVRSTGGFSFLAVGIAL